MQHEREEPEAERAVEKPGGPGASRGREGRPDPGAGHEFAETPASVDDVLDVPPRPAVDPVVVPRWVQLVTLPLAIVGLVALLEAAGPIVLLFTIAALIALLLNPFVTLLRRLGIPRGVAVLLTWLGLVLVVVGVGVLLANPIADQVTRFQNNLPGLIDDATKSLDDLQAWLDKNGVQVQIQAQGQSALQTIGDNVARGSGELVSFTRDALTLAVEASIALILVLVLSIYMLLYGEQIGNVVRRIVPAGDGTPEDDFPTRIQAAVFGYVRGQFLFSLIMGASAGVGLWILGSLGVFPDGKTYALFFGVFYGFAELIPYIGPAIGAFPPVVVAAFSDHPLDAVWLAIFFTALQQIEGHIVAPNVFAQALRINPLLVILALLLGGQLYGFIGAFVALPVAAVIRETVVYLRRHLVLEPWGTPSAAELALRNKPPPVAACPECGTPRPEGAAFCPACGTELGSADEAAAAASAAPG
jgi:predicted PurR-regulated permease PerM